ncbi:BCCT family transporter [Phaeobacter gallaeciensis]|uniref:Transporter, BCCT family n=1 Tax=Phaeobacter gallaeciensis TaxID=60890 RepID=A0AAC9Z9E9_9RHOB|nr:BCCT family transporter [Phaeobacter gallaeciensis]AHD09001.1 Choline-glycine betaine transporter [Phaeobacter gallaeciensis DSM 26640]ATE92267.1 transporter, BCCT family [Phaeobacter gallaeciensis]ATE97914.1 transporter, BCCT family [Phaeobacter gallaeciensis]ATF00929.1 transporter, BCCT family [Phaeobacter gallaeciensis]ATF05309.1 transporter, BCCT family [Phaeobacter gallaeciensis]
MTTIISAGILLAFALVIFCVIKWWNMRIVGVTPVPLFTFIAILFTSGLDVGLIMFPLAFDYPLYADTAAEPAYAFTNPLALEFGFWGFLIWAFYFLTSFYFCAIEPRVKFFEIGIVKLLNNLVIITTCAFTGALFLIYMPYYIAEVGDGETVIPAFYVICFLVILAAAYSSTDIKYVRILSVGSTFLFFALILGMWAYAGMGLGEFATTAGNIGGYFGNIHKFILPLTEYHEFYLFWWFAWSIMIGQFTSRFVGGLTTWQLLAALLVFPSIPLAVWFSVLYFYHLNTIPTAGLINWSMTVVGILFVINSFDSLIRLYTDNMNLSAERLGKLPYVLGNAVALFALTLAFQSQWLQIQWVGTVVIGIYIACLIYIFAKKRSEVAAITTSPEENTLDFDRIKAAH